MPTPSSRMVPVLPSRTQLGSCPGAIPAATVARIAAKVLARTPCSPYTAGIVIPIIELFSTLHKVHFLPVTPMTL